MTAQAPGSADARSRHSAVAPASVGAGVLVGLVCFVALNWLNAEWLEQFGLGPTGQPGLLVLLAGVIAAIASALAYRYPGVGLWSGVVMTTLVVVGLVLGSPGDVGLGDDSWATPGTITSHGAHFPVTAAVAGTLLAVSLTVHRARVKQQH